MATQISMRPLVLIATHERVDMTLTNIALLMEQTTRCDILVICSHDVEFERFNNESPSPVYVAQVNNNPIGNKWQFGVDIARTINPSHLIILGSDDFLGRDFIQSGLDLMERESLDFIGLRSFWMFQPQSTNLHLLEYAFPGVPIGGGRIYSRRMLDTIGWRVFNRKKEKHLDDDGFKLVQKSGHKYKLITDIEDANMNIIAIKGGHKVINTAEAILTRKDRIKINQYYPNGSDKYNQIIG